MHLPHLFNFIEVYHEAPLVGMVLFDALSTEDSQVIGAVEVLYSLVVLLAQEALDAFFIFKVNVPKNMISLYDLV